MLGAATFAITLAIAFAMTCGAATCAPAGAAAGPPVYRPPTDAPVLDPFRPPPEPWLPGNRGIEYATTVGSPVRAIGPGAVAFAGPVAGRLVVTVNHPDGVRSSYVGLAGIAVSVGDRVDAGQIIGLSADRLHLGVRRGDRYLDPAGLWGSAVGGGHAHLVSSGGTGAARTAGDPAGGRASPTRRPLHIGHALRSIRLGW